MARGINSAFQGQLDSGKYTYAIGVFMEFDNGRVRVTNYHKNLPHPTPGMLAVYTSAGQLLRVSSVDENTDLGISGLTVTLSGLDPTIISKMRDTDIQGVPVEAYLFIIDSGQIVYEHLYFKGVIDNMTYTQSRETATITLNCENFLVRFGDKLNRKYTVQDQKIYHPNDDGLDFVEDIAEQQIVWGI